MQISTTPEEATALAREMAALAEERARPLDEAMWALDDVPNSDEEEILESQIQMTEEREAERSAR
jgi:hypothetical protein